MKNTFRRQTIAAISTPWGEGGIGIVRISGPLALDIAGRVLRLAQGSSLAEMPPGTVRYGQAAAVDGNLIDEVLAFAFRAPKSYTREDLVEIQAHGGPTVLRRLLEAVLAAGAVLAEPGEFTARAVLNGRLNLIQAEAVLDLIRAKTEGAAEAAIRRLTGDDGRVLAAVEEELFSLLAEVEAALDFPDEVPAPEQRAMADRAGEIEDKLAAVLAGAGRGRLLSEGATVAIIGRPNAGKSSLLNCLLGEERAIVTAQPGTTRDAVAEEVDIEGIPVRLVDTAGLGAGGDRLEELGMARSRQEMARADLLLLVIDASEPLTPEDEAVAREAADHGRGVVALNKCDRPALPAGSPVIVAGWPAIRVSALTGQGVSELAKILAEQLGGRPGESAPTLSHLRQIEAAKEARMAVAHFRRGLDTSLAWDFLAEDLRAALSALARLTGRELGPELLKTIFSQFCLGK